MLQKILFQHKQNNSHTDHHSGTENKAVLMEMCRCKVGYYSVYSIIIEMKCEKLKCQVLQIRACPIKMVVTNIALISITFPFGISAPVRRVSEMTTVRL